MKKLSYKARVENGARWLDENFPGWVERIDLETLNLGDAGACICGQVFKKKARSGYGYTYARQTLFSEANSWITSLVNMDPIGRRSTRCEKIDRADKVALLLGFNIDSGDDNNNESYESLQRAWVRYLKQRRAHSSH